MRRPRLRSRLPAALGAAAVVVASAVVLLPTAAHASSDAGAVISNGTVQLGVNALGDLNYNCGANEESGCPGDSAAPNSPSGDVGLRYVPNNLESMADGSPSEGWGVADADSGLTGYVNEYDSTTQAPVAQNVSPVSFTSTPTSATSTVAVQSARSGQSLQVVQSYAPSAASPNIYANTVTITNTGSIAVGDLRYRRTVDWDIEPTAFHEWVTAGGSSPQLAFNSDDGFASSNPMAGTSYVNSTTVCNDDYDKPCSYTDLGEGGVHADNPDATPDDAGALYDFAFGGLDAGQSFTFTLFYGAAPSETAALAALNAVGAEVYSLGESSCTNDSVADCEPTDPGGEGGGDICSEGCARPGPAEVRPDAVQPAAADPPLAGVDLGQPATFVLGFVVSTSDVSITQTDDPDPATVGDPLTYDLTVQNDGPDPASNIVVDDPLPAGVTFGSATTDSGTCVPSTSTATPPITTVHCTLGTLAPDATDDVQLTVTPTQTGALSNTATVGTASFDPDLSNNTDTEPTRVQPVPPPTAGDDNYTTPQDTILNVAAPGVLANDTDPRGGTLTVAPGSVSTPAHGTVTVDANGAVHYSPTAGYRGADTFTYKAQSGARMSAAATVSITVTPVNHPPVAHADAYTTNEDTPRTVAAPGVLGNDTDPDGDALTAVLDTGPTHGTLTLQPNGSFVYTPNPNYNGADSFTYHASDGMSTSQPVTVSLTVNPVDDGIQAADDAYTVPPNDLYTASPATNGVLANDVNTDGGTLTAELVSGPTSGTLQLNADGTFTFTSAGRTAATFTYRARNSLGEVSNVATVELNPSDINRAPVAEDDTYLGSEDTPVTADAATGVLDNDTDPDGDSLTATLLQAPTHGSVDFQSNGSFVYTPDPNFNGTDSFTYHDSDGNATSNTATVTLRIDAVDDPPVAVPDEYSTPEDTTLNVAAPGVLGNDSDVDGDGLGTELQHGPDHGTLTLHQDGSFTYVPNPGFSGTDTFTYFARAGEGSSDAATVTLHVTPVNHAPVATPDSYTTAHDTTLTVALPGVLKNDTDPDGNALEAVLVSGPAHGTLTLNPSGRFVYTPDTGFSGTDSFRYRASDGVATSAAVRATITVTAPVVPPTSTPPSTPTTPVPTTPVPTTPTSDGPAPPAVPTDTPTPVDTPTDPSPLTDGPTSDEPTEIPTAPSTPATNPPSSSGPQRSLRLTAPSVIPGGALRAKGSGCAPSSAIQLTVAGRPAGSGQADSSGGFDLPVSTTGLGVGTYSVTATCGDKQLVSQVALVYVTANSNAPTAQALVVAAALAFFLLLLGLVLRRPTS